MLWEMNFSMLWEMNFCAHACFDFLGQKTGGGVGGGGGGGGRGGGPKAPALHLKCA